jgi:sialate O-acetylesterase
MAPRWYRRAVPVALATVLFGAPEAQAQAQAQAQTWVSAWIGDHMVVQQGRPVRLSGTDRAGQAIHATLGGATGVATADAQGRWVLALPAPPAGGPFVLTIEGSSRATFTDVLSGEVWVASGQSNMELPLRRSTGAADAIAAGCAGLRLFEVPQQTAAAPQVALNADEARWQRCDASNAVAFSAVAFHFGREIHRALGTPVGLILTAWGGTPAETWTPRDALVAEPTLKPLVDAFDAAVSDPVARAAQARRLADWEAANFQQDVGNRGQALGYARPSADVTGWAKMALPQLWEAAGLAIDGAVWFRREVDLPAAWAGQDLALSLGALDDFDVTYWNGERVGATGIETPHYWSAPRRYTVPARLVRPGRNLIAVRVFDHVGSGGFAGTRAQLTVAPAAAGTGVTSLSLAGAWLYKVERRLKPITADFATRPHPLGVDDPESPSMAWNGMVAPLARLPIAGVIWYQGESNAGHAHEYRTLFPAMIRAWRAAWGQPALPFLFVQLPNYDPPHPAGARSDSSWALLREAQALALQLPRTAMAVTLDLGLANDLHPPQKQEIGRRLALGALRMVYGKSTTIASGPTFLSAAREGAAMRVRFASGASGLDTADGGPARGFVIAGVDRAFHPAAARIDGDSVILTSPDVPEPVAVRYGWGNDPENTLRNQADLPAAPFRTDDWPVTRQD